MANEVLCLSCRSFAPALDPNIVKAFLGGCRKKEWPFTLILPLEGVTECDVYERSARLHVPLPLKEEEKVAAATSEPLHKRVEFYYSSVVAPGEQFSCDTKKAVAGVKELAARGIEATAVDVGEGGDLFPTYHKAVTGPSAAKRAVFGMKGALEEDFARKVPALLVFEGAHRYPVEVFPRMDRELNRVVGIQEALELLLRG